MGYRMRSTVLIATLLLLVLPACGEGVGGDSGSGGNGGRTGTGGAAGGDPGQVLFRGDFETGDLTQWEYEEQCQPGRITVYSSANVPAGAPMPREGTHAVRFRVLDTDVEPCTSSENPRAELESSEELFKPGDDRWEAWSILIPTSHPQPLCGSCTDSGWFAFQEDYGPPYDGPASIGWFLDFTPTPQHFRMHRGEQYDHDRPGAAVMTKGRWVDFLVHKKFANTANGGGFVEAWVDKMPITFDTCNCTKLMTQTMQSSQTNVGFYLTSYRERGFFETFDVFYDAIRVGTTRGSVELP